ncbi:MAG: hypothetical protein HC929_05495 [Leptolyngbyaceae cyanobacterium SM2_5_2]|nr:hypothetical protein [Leptolyngbyaceae cyanobacterium SM2_5_2]
MTNNSRRSGLAIWLIVLLGGLLLGGGGVYWMGNIQAFSKFTAKAGNIFNTHKAGSTSNSLSEQDEEFELSSQIIDTKLQQEIQGLLLENSHLRSQIIQYDNQDNLLKGEVSNVHERLVETDENLNQKEYETTLMSQCVMDLAVAFNVLDSMSDDIVGRDVNGIATGLIASQQPLQQALTSWRFGTCNSARKLAEAYQEAGKLFLNGQVNTTHGG